MVAWVAGGGRARARSGLSDGGRKQPPSSSRCSVRGGRGRGTAAMAAWEAAARRVEPWRRQRRQEASQGHARRFPAVATAHVGHEPFLWKKSGTMCMWISRVVRVSAVRAGAILTLPTFLRTVVCLLYCWCDMKKVL